MGKGRPPGSRNKKTVYQDALESHGPELINQVKLLALKPNPDIRAVRLWLERLVPIAKPPNSRFRLPRLETAADLPKVLSAIARAAANGRISTQEGAQMCQLIEGMRHAFDVAEFDKRLQVLEKGVQEQTIELPPDQPDTSDEDHEKKPGSPAEEA